MSGGFYTWYFFFYLIRLSGVSDHAVPSLYSLWKYQQSVQDILLWRVDRFKGVVARHVLKGLDCDRTSSEIPEWIDDYMVHMAYDLSLFDLAEFQIALVRHVSNTVTAKGTVEPGCLHCKDISKQTIDDFWSAVTYFVRACMRKVSVGHATSSNPSKSFQAEAVFFIPKKSVPPKDHTGSDTASLPLPDCLEVGAADIVLQSADSVNFRVHKSRLAASSPVFKDVFSLPQPSNDETVDGLPVVRLLEDAGTVRALIIALYGTHFEIPASYESVLALLGAAQKYDMPAVKSSVLDRVGRVSVPAKAQVYREYAIAFGHRLSHETAVAARFTLDFPLTFEAIGKNLALFEGSALCMLANYRKLCLDSVISCLKLFLDVREGPSAIWVGCPGSKGQLEQSKKSPGRCEPLHKQSSQWIPVGEPTSESSCEGDDQRKLPPWLRDLFMQEIEQSMNYFTTPFANPSRIRWKYLAALKKHAPDQHGCVSCLIVHAHSGERYCAELKRRLTHARNDPKVSTRVCVARISRGLNEPFVVLVRAQVKWPKMRCRCPASEATHASPQVVSTF